ncbi:putative inactive tyrosine-protein kinase Wsck [Culicoides brevitarsis]|uniref:putative inactive tyrosine-protein kinase Wsck n=1 Tax=Culicoides brevitarsis TaxID=469753 RepID=UPI00307C73A8
MISLRSHHTLASCVILFFFVIRAANAEDDSSFLGCYKKLDGLERIRRVHSLTVQNCVKACEEENKAFALLGSIECFCSNSKEERDVVENARCLSCSYDDAVLCGSFDVVAYYKTPVEVPGAMLTLFITNVTNTSIAIRWDRPLDAFKKITEYQVKAEVEFTFGTNIQMERFWTVQPEMNEYELSNLHPGTTYNITLYAMQNGDVSANSSIQETTFIGVPYPKPEEPIILSESDTTKTIEIMRTDSIYHNENGPVSAWRVVVHMVEGDLYQPFDPELLRDYRGAREDGLPYYIAAEVGNRTKTLTIGDGNRHGDFENPPLPVGKHIHISIGVVSMLNNRTEVLYSDTTHDQHTRMETIAIDLPEEQDGTNQTLVIILTAACIILGLLLITSSIAYCFLRVRAGRRVQRLSDHHELTVQSHAVEMENNGYVGDNFNNTNFSESLSLLADRLDTNQQIPRKNLTLDIDNVIANGAYGEVIRGSVSKNNISTTCQVHTVQDDMEKPEQNAFLKEFNQLMELSGHESFLRFFGVCKTPDWFYLVFEDVSRTLKRYLLDARVERSDRFSSVSEEMVMTIISDLGNALEYLEQNHIAHKKLNSFNVRVNQDEEVKIGFFGPTHFDENGKTIDTRRWDAPEVLKNINSHSTKSDVWSFGVLMWECCCLGATPYGNIVATDLLPRIRNGARCEQTPFMFDDLYQLLLNCWELDAKERPTFAEINNFLKQLMTSIEHALTFNRRDGIQLPYHLPLLEVKN